MNWLYYLLEANLYLAIFYGFYRLFLHRETFYQLNRYYLLGTSVLAFLLPVFQIGYLNGLIHPSQNPEGLMIQYVGETAATVAAAPAMATGDVLFVGYMLVVAFFLLRLGTSLYRIVQMAIRADKTRKNGFIQVHVGQSGTAFSFFNLLFINPGTDRENIIVKHEMIHIREKHSLDILFFELLLICNWFNPLCWLMKQDIKLVHEYIADEATTNQGLAKHDYALFLIRNSFGSFPNPLTSQMFNQSILKNRISMLNKTKTAGRARLRLLYVLPLTGGMLCVSTLGFTKDYAIVDLYAKKNPAVTRVILQEPKQEKKNSFAIESVYDKETGNNRPIKLIVINGKISKAQNIFAVEDYDKLVKLNGTEATAKYGKRAASGALEFEGAKTKMSITFPPPGPPKPPTPPKRRKLGAMKLPPPPLAPKGLKSIEVELAPPLAPKRADATKTISFKAVDNKGDKGVAEPAEVSFVTDKIQLKEAGLSEEQQDNQIRIEEPKKAEGNGNELNKINVTAPKKEALTEVNIAVKKNITKEIEKARAIQQKKKD
ncbi:MAG: M56 family metallopeptidase [Bacteroidota bacterium]